MVSANPDVQGPVDMMHKLVTFILKESKGATTVRWRPPVLQRVTH